VLKSFFVMSCLGVAVVAGCGSDSGRRIVDSATPDGTGGAGDNPADAPLSLDTGTASDLPAPDVRPPGTGGSSSIDAHALVDASTGGAGGGTGGDGSVGGDAGIAGSGGRGGSGGVGDGGGRDGGELDVGREGSATGGARGGGPGNGGLSTGGAGGTSDGGEMDSWADDGDTGPGNEITSGTSTLLDLFVGGAGIYVLTSDSFYLVDRTGATIARVAVSTPVTSAAFDGDVFVLAGGARFRTYDTALSSVGSGDLLEPCVASVLVSGHRFVCGPSYDSDGVLSTYDAFSGRLLASSRKYLFGDISMKRVPGSDDFVSVTRGYPADFDLYSVDASGQAVYVNQSPYHGQIIASPVLSFDGDPAVHLVTDSGRVLKIRGTDCKALVVTSGCFVDDGDPIVVDPFSNEWAFAALDNDVAGRVYGLIEYMEYYSSSPFGTCAHGCTLYSIDVVSRSVLSKRSVALTSGQLAAFRHDPVANAAVIGYNKTGPGDASLASQGYSVVAVAY
jgi:hypothetical protein